MNEMLSLIGNGTGRIDKLLLVERDRVAVEASPTAMVMADQNARWADGEWEKGATISFTIPQNDAMEEGNHGDESND